MLLMYKGEQISEAEGKRREEMYQNQGLGCFIFYFFHEGSKLWCVYVSIILYMSF